MVRFVVAMPWVGLLCALALAEEPTLPCVGPDAIRSASRQLDQFEQLKRRGFLESEEGSRSKWRETTKPREATAFVYFDVKGKPVQAAFTHSTESGDWVLYVNYYFRQDGTLALRKEELRTFYGNAIVHRETFLGCSGEVLRRTTRHLDMETKKPKKPEDVFEDQRSPLFKRTADLPFAALLKLGQ